MLQNVPSDNVQRAWMSLMRVTPLIQERVAQRLKAEGLPPLEWYSVLWRLERACSTQTRPRDLGEALFLKRYNVSRLLDRMEAEGLVARSICPVDGRGQFIALTPAGKDMRKRMWAIYGPAMDEALGGLADDEAATLKTLLEKLICPSRAPA